MNAIGEASARIDGALVVAEITHDGISDPVAGFPTGCWRACAVLAAGALASDALPEDTETLCPGGALAPRIPVEVYELSLMPRGLVTREPNTARGKPPLP